MMLIDDRENEKVSHSILMQLGDAKQSKQGNAKILRLETGDYVWGQTAIEAKEINDLYHSIMGHGRSRTVNAQLIDMASNYEDCYLVVYGTKLKPYFNRGRKAGRQEAAIQIARMKAVIRGGKAEFYLRFPNIKYMELPTKEAFNEYIVTNYRQAVIAEATKGISKENRAAMKADTDSRVRVLAAIPGITDAIAKNILNKFGGLKGLLRAKTTQKELMAIQGVTRRKARAILELRRPYKLDD